MNQERILEFDKIKELWLEYAFTEKARERIRERVPFLSELELTAELRETGQACQLLEKCGNPPLASLNGIEDLLMIAEKGDCLAGWQLEQIKSTLTAVRRMIDYLKRGQAYDNGLAYYEENLDALEDLGEAIGSAIYNEEVADHASSRLQEIRRDIGRDQEKMREKAEQVIRSNKECMSDNFSTLRNGHVCIPVKKEYKFRISGSVIDKSSTGNTLFMEPAASAKYYEELQQLRMEEEDEVKRILYTLTVMVDENALPLRENIRVMEKLDFAFSKGKLSLSYGGTAPVILQERAVRLVSARHPLLDRCSCVPLQFSMGGRIRGVVITGPNTGGKTVALKTVALCCMMAQCGLHVPCERAEVCMFSNYLCDIGDGQNLSENLSTFSAHITNVLDILKRVNRESLVIMDELGSGTDPQEGMGIAVAILEELRKSEGLFLVTTHYPEVKNYAASQEGLVNARMTFDAENLQPLYQMIIGEAGESCALYIAKRLGMPEGMLRRAAEAAYGRGFSIYGTTPSIHGTVPVSCQLKESREQFLHFLTEEIGGEAPEGSALDRSSEKLPSAHIIRHKSPKKQKEVAFQRGDSVMIYPDKKVGIICQEANDKGILRVQLKGKKIWINYKRVKLLVPAAELYPPDYDFSIIFDSVENRKLRHKMERRFTEGEIHLDE